MPTRFDRIVIQVFRFLVYLAFLTPLLVIKELLFPFVTSKALYLRMAVELALPFYVYLIVSFKEFRPNIKNPLNISVAVFLVVNFISAFTGVNVNKSLWGNIERMGGVYYLLHLSLMYFYVLLLAKINSKYLQILLKWVVVGVASAAAIYGVLVGWGMNPLFPDPSLPRISSTFGNPIYVGSFLILPLALSVFFALQEENYGKKFLYWFLAVVQLVAIYMSGTRGATIGLIIGLFLAAVIYVALNTNRELKLWGGVAVIIFVIICSIGFAFNNKIPQSSTLHRLFHLNDSNTTARLIQWKMALTGYKDHPLLGVGPENYYVISDTYFNPEIYIYDGSWFDKPHNYILEILVTSGILGLLGYLSILVFCFWSLILAYKKQTIGLLEFCFLVGGLVAYQVQNLFVFDNVSASLMFYVFAAFCCYLFIESKNTESAKKNNVISQFPKIFTATVLVVALLVVGFAEYITNILPAKAMKDTNYGFAYATVDVVKAKNYFDSARNNSFNIDPGESAGKYADFCISMLQTPVQQSNPAFVESCFTTATEYLEEVVSKVDNYPIYWNKLANLYYIQAFSGNASMGEKGEEAINVAIKLAPKRTEALALLAQVRSLQGKIPEAIAIYKQAASYNARNKELQWQVALLENQIGQKDEAYTLGDKLLSGGYEYSSLDAISWMLDLYKQNKQYDKIFAIYQKAIDAKTMTEQNYINLAHLYAETGQKEKALQIAQAVINADPAKKNEMEDFIKTLK